VKSMHRTVDASEVRFSEARRHASDLGWAVEQIDHHGRWLGPVDLHDLAQSISGQLLWWVVGLGGGVEAPQVDLPIALAHAVEALQTVLILAEHGLPGAAETAGRLATLVAARVDLLGAHQAAHDLPGVSVLAW
jgi:hypothetical protein